MRNEKFMGCIREKLKALAFVIRNITFQMWFTSELYTPSIWRNARRFLMQENTFFAKSHFA